MASARSKENPELVKAMKAFERELSKQYQNAQGILREGDRIILPTNGTIRTHIATLERYAEAEDEVMNTQIHLDAHPDDALFALYTVIEQKFGALMSAMTFSFFGARPGEQRTIRISATETRVVPVGKTEIFGSSQITLYVEPTYDRSNTVGGWVDVTFQHPRMWEPFVKSIEEAVNEYLAHNSIFLHKAIHSDFSFMDMRYFNPERQVVYSAEERTKLGGEVFAPIVATKAWRDNGRPIKRGVLLYGDYGTGKSLTLAYIAKLCERNGWTYINVLPGDDITRVLEFAKRYSPAVIGVEDIDRDTGPNRDERVNKIINQFDSVVSKGDEVIVVMTTNHKDEIQSAMLRPGRIDTSIEVGVLDAHAVKQMILNELHDSNDQSILQGELDAELLYEHAKGYTKAFLAEAVRRATGYAVWRLNEQMEGNINGDHLVKVTQKDIVDGLDGQRDQWALMRREREVPAPQIDAQITNIVNEVVEPLRKEVYTLTGKVGLRKDGK